MLEPRTTTSELAEQPPSGLEAGLRHSRITAFILLLAVPAVCWVWVIAMARDMYGPMTGASQWMMTGTWDASHLFLLWAMWTVMMIGMMLPTAAPLVLLYGAAARRQGVPGAARHVYALAGGYVSVWVLFGTAATALQRILARLLVLSPMMEMRTPFVAAGVLVFAGLYQFTPLKHACLRACQSPLGFLMARWRSGGAGAFRLGVEHGAFCVGCCWVLMLLLFVGGVMNLTVIAGLTALVAAEKTGLVGRWGSDGAGVILVCLGLATLRGVL